MKGHVQKAVFNLLQVSTYHRPGSLLKLRKLGLVRPTSGVTGVWSMATSLSETSDVSKVGTKDDSIMLDSEWLPWRRYGSCVELQLPRAPDGVQAKQCAEELKIAVVPYQARHSGPSIDRANKSRDLDEVRKRGGWLTRQSVNRYEKAGRLAATWQKLDHSVQSACKPAERHLESIILGHPYPPIQLPH